MREASPAAGEVALLRDAVVRFLRDRAIEVVRRAEETGIFPRDLFAEAGAAGLYGAIFPERIGGSALGFAAAGVVAEEMGRLTPGFSVTLNQQAMSCPYTILRFGRPEVAEPFVAGLIAGRKIGMWSLTEAGGGSDPASTVRTRAVRDGDDYVITGTKIFATGSDQCDVGVLFARTGGEGHRGLSAFIVEPRGNPTWVARPIAFHGLSRVFNSCEVAIDGLRVPAALRLGAEGEGFAIAMQALAFGRFSVAARALGVAKGCLEEAITHSRNRVIRGQKLAEMQAVQMDIGEVDAAIFAAEATLRELAALLDARAPANRVAAIAKYVCARAAKLAAELLTPLFGGYGLAAESQISTLRAHANLFDIGEGAPSVQKLLIGRHALGLQDADRHPIAYLDA